MSKNTTKNTWKPPSFLKNMRPIKKSDYTLTDKEYQLLTKNGFTHIDCCLMYDEIEKNINRPFCACQVCYDCVGDNKYYDNKNLCIFVTNDLKNISVFLDKKCPYKYYL